MEFTTEMAAKLADYIESVPEDIRPMFFDKWEWFDDDTKTEYP